jgi:hypothetical protein
LALMLMGFSHRHLGTITTKNWSEGRIRTCVQFRDLARTSPRPLDDLAFILERVSRSGLMHRHDLNIVLRFVLHPTRARIAPHYDLQAF